MRGFRNPHTLNARSFKQRQEATIETQKTLIEQAMLKRVRREMRNKFNSGLSLAGQYASHWLLRKEWERTHVVDE